MPSSQRIKERRQQLGLSLEDVAGRLRPYWPKITRGMVSKTENNKRTIPADELWMWAKALECRPEQLVDPIPD